MPKKHTGEIAPGFRTLFKGFVDSDAADVVVSRQQGLNKYNLVENRISGYVSSSRYKTELTRLRNIFFQYPQFRQSILIILKEEIIANENDHIQECLNIFKDLLISQYATLGNKKDLLLVLFQLQITPQLRTMLIDVASATDGLVSLIIRSYLKRDQDLTKRLFQLEANSRPIEHPFPTVTQFAAHEHTLWGIKPEEMLDRIKIHIPKNGKTMLVGVPDHHYSEHGRRGGLKTIFLCHIPDHQGNVRSELSLLPPPENDTYFNYPPSQIAKITSDTLNRLGKQKKQLISALPMIDYHRFGNDSGMKQMLLLHRELAQPIQYNIELLLANDKQLLSTQNPNQILNDLLKRLNRTRKRVNEIIPIPDHHTFWGSGGIKDLMLVYATPNPLTQFNNIKYKGKLALGKNQTLFGKKPEEIMILLKKTLIDLETQSNFHEFVTIFPIYDYHTHPERSNGGDRRGGLKDIAIIYQ